MKNVGELNLKETITLLRRILESYRRQDLNTTISLSELMESCFDLFLSKPRPILEKLNSTAKVALGKNALRYMEQLKAICKEGSLMSVEQEEPSISLPAPVFNREIPVRTEEDVQYGYFVDLIQHYRYYEQLVDKKQQKIHIDHQRSKVHIEGIRNLLENFLDKNGENHVSIYRWTYALKELRETFIKANTDLKNQPIIRLAKEFDSLMLYLGNILLGSLGGDSSDAPCAMSFYFVDVIQNDLGIEHVHAFILNRFLKILSTNDSFILNSPPQITLLRPQLQGIDFYLIYSVLINYTEAKRLYSYDEGKMMDIRSRTYFIRDRFNIIESILAITALNDNEGKLAVEALYDILKYYFENDSLAPKNTDFNEIIDNFIEVFCGKCSANDLQSAKKSAAYGTIHHQVNKERITRLRSLFASVTAQPLLPVVNFGNMLNDTEEIEAEVVTPMTIPVDVSEPELGVCQKRSREEAGLLTPAEPSQGEPPVKKKKVLVRRSNTCN